MCCLIKYTMNTGTQEKAEAVYRKLTYFYEEKKAIHFCLLRGGWKNGEIVDLSSRKLAMVLREFKEGIIPILLEEIDVKTISEYKERGGA